MPLFNKKNKTSRLNRILILNMFSEQNTSQFRIKKPPFSQRFCHFVLEVGIEPTHPKILDFESSDFNTKIN